MCPEFKDWKKLANIFLSKTVNLEFQNLMIKILATTLNWGESRKWIGISWISGCRSGFIHLRYFDPHTSSNKYRFNPILAVLPAVRKNMRFTRQPRSSSSSAVKVKITAPGLVFLLSSFMDKAACLLLWSWLPRRHYMQDSFIVQRIQPQLLHMAWIASVKQRLLYLVCTCSSLSLSLVASQLSSSSCCGRSTCVTPWGRCRRRSTSLATWPSLFTMSSSCRRFSMSSGNRL